MKLKFINADGSIEDYEVESKEEALEIVRDCTVFNGIPELTVDGVSYTAVLQWIKKE